MKSFKKKFLLLLITLVLIFITAYLPAFSSNIYRLNKSPQLDNSWPIYRNFTVGMDVNFPPTWTYKDGYGDMAFALDEPLSESKYKDPSTFYIKIMGVYEGEKNKDIDGYKSIIGGLKSKMEQESQAIPYGAYKLLYEGEVEINGVRGYMLNCTLPKPAADHNIESICVCMTGSQNYSYFILATYPQDDYYKNIYLNIISSIVFP